MPTYEAIIKVDVADALPKRARDIADGIGYACMLLTDEYGWTYNQVVDLLDAVQDEVRWHAS